MILVFDIGNTNIKAGLFKGDMLLQSLRLTSSASKTGDEYWVLLKDIFAERSLSPKDVKGVVIASVNPNLNYTIENMVSYYIGVKALIVGGGIKCGLNIKYDNPKEVGADRIVGALAAYSTHKNACVVVDCGTATTFNVVTAKGEFLGGPISIGLKTATDALSKAAAKLPNIELNFPSKTINKNTISNMQSGILYGYVGQIEYLINRIKAELGYPLKVVATGGIADLVATQTNMFDEIDRTLTLRGLKIIFEINQK